MTRPAATTGSMMRASSAARPRAERPGATIIRIGLIALMVGLVALVIARLASTPEAALPLSVVVVAGLGAAAVAEANRRWQPRRMGRDGRARSTGPSRHTDYIRQRRAD